MKIYWKPLIISILIPLALGGISGLLIKDSMQHFDNVVQPALTPPNIVFPIVWTILYTLMGISFYLILTTPDKNSKTALFLYITQLLVNVIWPIIFFNYKNYLFAFVWIILLIVLIVLMITEMYKVKKCAAYLQIPYLIWVSFAAYLNFSTYLLNK